MLTICITIFLFSIAFFFFLVPEPSEVGLSIEEELPEE
jgi:hypothetical protein